MGVNEKTVLTTLLYSDIFDYPLTQDEIWLFAIGNKISRPAVLHALGMIKSKIYQKDGYFVLKKRDFLIELRRKREGISKKKYTKALYAARLLSYIPTILFIGVSGSCAMGNADVDADIDLFIITRQNTMWLSRLLSVFILEATMMRRRRLGKKQDSICLNMFSDENDLQFDRGDLYLAHEIVQLKPLVNKDNTHEKFLLKNKWIKNYLPNSKLPVIPAFSLKMNYKRDRLIETFARKIQIWYMQKHRTRELITNTRAFFHPYDYRHFVLNEFMKRKKRYAV